VHGGSEDGTMEPVITAEEVSAKSLVTCEKRGSRDSAQFIVQDRSFCRHHSSVEPVLCRSELPIAPRGVINRYYDPATGQFMSVDPLVGLTGAAYSYCGADPFNASDPMGMISLNPLQWLLDAVNNIANPVNQAGQNAVQSVNKLVGDEQNFAGQISILAASLQGASDPQTICAQIAAYNQKIQIVKAELSSAVKVLQIISTIQLQLSQVYGVIAQLSGVATIWACVVGLATSVVGIAEGAAEALIGAIATAFGAGSVPAWIPVSEAVGEIIYDLKGCWDSVR